MLVNGASGGVGGGGPVATTTQKPDEAALAAAGLTGGAVWAQAVREVTGPLAAQATDGTLVIDVATVLPFERAAEGLATLAAGQAHGKIVVTIAEQSGSPGWL